MTVQRFASRYLQQVAGILLLLAVCGGLACPTVSIGSTEQVKCQAAASEDPGKALEGGPWLLQEVNSAIVQLPAGERQPYLLFQRLDGRVTGYSGCNEFFGSYDLKGDMLTFGPLGMTRKFCADAAGEVEQAFLGVLSKTRGWRVDRQMLLLIEGDHILARLRRERRGAQQ